MDKIFPNTLEFWTGTSSCAVYQSSNQKVMDVLRATGSCFIGAIKSRGEYFFGAIYAGPGKTDQIQHQGGRYFRGI